MSTQSIPFSECDQRGHAGGTVRIYTDGACVPNPGVGGWGVVVLMPDGTRNELSGSEDDTTNNRMEAQAAIVALDSLPAGCAIEVFTDSEYLQKAAGRWISKWSKGGWKLRDGTAVKNRDLWEQLIVAQARHRRVTWRWIRGHAGHEHNERADALAQAARSAQVKRAG